MLRNVKRLAAILAIFSSGPALARVIDFELPSAQYGPTYEQDGFKLSYSWYDPLNPYATLTQSVVFSNWIKIGRPEFNANGNNATILPTNNNTTIIISASDNSPFSFEGISLADVHNEGLGGVVDFVFKYASGNSQAKSVSLKPELGLQDFSFSEKNLTSFTFAAREISNRRYQFDFLKVNGDFVSSVPEPSTWALMLIGFGIVGYAARRTRRPSMRMQVV